MGITTSSQQGQGSTKMIIIKYILPLLLSAVIIHGKKFLLETDDHDNNIQDLNHSKQGDMHSKLGQDNGKQGHDNGNQGHKDSQQGKNYSKQEQEGDDYGLITALVLAGIGALGR